MPTGREYDGRAGGWQEKNSRRGDGWHRRVAQVHEPGGWHCQSGGLRELVGFAKAGPINFGIMPPMKRAWRWIRNGLTMLSLSLCLACAGAWIVGRWWTYYRQASYLDAAKLQSDTYEFAFGPDRKLVFAHYRQTFSRVEFYEDLLRIYPAQPLPGWGSWERSYSGDQTYEPPRNPEPVRFLGVRYGHIPKQPFWSDQRDRGWDEARWMVVPLWLATALFGLAPAWVILRKVLSKRRFAPGKCQNCGYDLRATPDRCPECGKIRRAL